MLIDPRVEDDREMSELVRLTPEVPFPEAEGRPIRVGLVGCGHMGSGMVHVTHQMAGMDTVAFSDIAPARAMETLRKLGVPPRRSYSLVPATHLVDED